MKTTKNSATALIDSVSSSIGMNCEAHCSLILTLSLLVSWLALRNQPRNHEKHMTATTYNICTSWSRLWSSSWLLLFPHSLIPNQSFTCSNHAAIIFSNTTPSNNKKHPYQLKNWCLGMLQITAFSANLEWTLCRQFQFHSYFHVN